MLSDSKILKTDLNLLELSGNNLTYLIALLGHVRDKTELIAADVPLTIQLMCSAEFDKKFDTYTVTLLKCLANIADERGCCHDRSARRF